MSAVALVYKNFAIQKGISHIGLGVSALNTAKVLRANGHKAVVWPVSSINGLIDNLRKDSTITHVNISAPWFPTMELATLCYNNPEIKFAVTSHSNVGFLQADTRGVQLIREELDLEQNSFNFRCAGNSARYVDWVTSVFDRPVILLPNLYHLDDLSGRPNRTFSGNTLRIGAFGATRPLKNLMTAGAAALLIAKNLRAHLTFSISGKRNDGGGSVITALCEMFRGLPYATLKENDWQTWSDFRRTVAHQHLLLQPSYTESFNIVTADGVAEGVPSVVSDSIDWAPDHWKANVDDATEIAKVGMYLLHDCQASNDGLKALVKHNTNSVRHWETWLRM